ncbi:hypothetical protein LCGC14_0208450 [marine sediment metagenome]|uniref:Uncharacterized protein n=1 Tax=marine sediment metagenome TaxID=412755 RepID=A0A0F9UL51_9ZZZZ
MTDEQFDKMYSRAWWVCLWLFFIALELSQL